MEKYYEQSFYEVFQLALVTWREQIFKHLNERVANVVLKLIKRERNGGMIDSQLMLNVMIYYLHLSEVDDGTPNPDFPNPPGYKNNFELFLQQDAERSYSVEFLRENPFIESLKYVERRLNEVSERIHVCLSENALSSLANTCERVLLEEDFKLRTELQVWKVLFVVACIRTRVYLHRIWAGDSGGPLMLPIHQNGTFPFYQIGIVSFSYHCARENVPGIFSSVQFHADWIEQQLENKTEIAGENKQAE